MTKQIEVRGLEELQRRFAMYPFEYAKIVNKNMTTALLVLHENVPDYPPKPASSNYRRTGTLGKSLGITQSGAQLGMPDIFKVKRVGGFDYEGRFGTNLNYAPTVIGERGRQSSFFSQYWWRLEQIVGPSYQKILQVFRNTADELARFLAGK